MVEWIQANWEWALLGFMVVEKAIKLSPTKYDDMLFDMILKPMFNAMKGKK